MTALLTFRVRQATFKEWFHNATAEARKLFGSNEFKKILDGHLAEEYGPLLKTFENELKGESMGYGVGPREVIEF